MPKGLHFLWHNGILSWLNMTLKDGMPTRILVVSFMGYGEILTSKLLLIKIILLVAPAICKMAMKWAMGIKTRVLNRKNQQKANIPGTLLHPMCTTLLGQPTLSTFTTKLKAPTE